jgi:hypothetical protein
MTVCVCVCVYKQIQHVSSIRIYIERVLNNTEFQNIRMVSSLLQFVPNLERTLCPDGNRIIM